MKSQKLTNSMKDTIVERILAKVFGERLEELKKQKMALADACYAFRYTKKELGMIQELQLQTNNRAFSNKEAIYMYFGGRHASLAMSVPRLFLYKDMESKTKLAADHKLTVQWDAQQNREYDLLAEKNKLAKEVRALLNSVNTTKQLLEAWPESEIFLKGLLETSGQLLPMVQVKTLNEVIFK